MVVVGVAIVDDGRKPGNESGLVEAIGYEGDVSLFILNQVSANQGRDQSVMYTGHLLCSSDKAQDHQHNL